MHEYAIKGINLFKGGLKISEINSPTIFPQPDIYPEEMWGIEDPRITYMEELQKWAITYTSFSRKGPTVSLAFTNDFVEFEKKGSITSPDDKDAALFPKKFNDKNKNSNSKQPSKSESISRQKTGTRK